MRANNGMLGTATATTMAVWLCPITAATLSAKSKLGTASKMSVRRMISESTHPPNAPATRPKNAPATAPMPSDNTPIISEARAPKMSRDSSSRPPSSSPNQWSRDGPGIDVGLI